MSFTEVPVIPVLVLLVLLCLAAGFVRFFFIPAKRLDQSLKRIIQEVERTRAAGSQSLTECFGSDEAIAALWNEYRETLHVQKAIDA